MIERCNYCGKEHDTGDGSTFHGAMLKTCPEHPPDPMFTFIDFNSFRRFTHDKESLELRLITVEDDKAHYEMVLKYQNIDNMKIFPL